jgi:hypothetical protein
MRVISGEGKNPAWQGEVIQINFHPTLYVYIILCAVSIMFALNY